MSAGLEGSRYGQAPVELFEFMRGADAWRLTSADIVIAFLGATFTPCAGLSRGEISHTGEATTGSVDVTLPLRHPLVTAVLGPLPPTDLRLVIRRLQRQDLQADTLFIGTVASFSFAAAAVTLKCLPLEARLARSAPGLAWQSDCNWVLYSAGCGVASAAYRDTATLLSVDRMQVRFSSTARRADGWYRRGWLESAVGERRTIEAHIGNLLTLAAPCRALAAGDVVALQAGCLHIEADCQNKFGNLVHFLGFPRMPGRNPFTGSV